MNHSPNCPTCRGIKRRHFLGIIPGALSLAILSAPQPALAEKTATTFVLSCIDFRFIEAERYFLSLKNLSNKYDLVALAGASLALSGIPHQADAQAFWDQLELSYRLHHIQKVIILDHQDCAIYADKIDPELSENPEREQEVHTEYLSRAYWEIRDRYPDLNIELYFVTLNAEVKPISPIPKG
ncbi:carbonic anhydrase [Argonema galeatum]|uniref:carbonic anhydrase n=1 Tax=Argonema galeatum TaxID=2942762 RepID=UPI002011AE75|nr:carbonic anhydrase [Argonema galeatum]MCL1462878.1 carbonic anhydrase [Argonema galeatum A003/A1]